MKNTIALFLGLYGFALLGSCQKSDEKYFPQVKTIIAANCSNTCHNAGTYQGLPVFLDTDSSIVQHAAAIKAAVADPVSPTNKRMPQDGQLAAGDISIIKKWVANGGTEND